MRPYIAVGPICILFTGTASASAGQGHTGGRCKSGSGMGTYPAGLANAQTGGQGQTWIPCPNAEWIPGRVCRGSLLLTVLARADGDFNDGVADLSGRLPLREHVLRRAGQGDVQQSRNVRRREPSAGALRQGQWGGKPIVQRSLG